MKKKFDAGLFVVCMIPVSIGIVAIISDWHSPVIWIVLDMVFWSVLIFAGIFILTAVICGSLGLLSKDETVRQSDTEEFEDIDILLEEDEEEKKARRKAMRRIKKLQRDYPEMWELMVEPEDEYLCFDYIYEKKKEKEQEESAGFAAVWTALNAGNSSNGNSSN